MRMLRGQQSTSRATNAEGNGEARHANKEAWETQGQGFKQGKEAYCKGKHLI